MLDDFRIRGWRPLNLACALQQGQWMACLAADCVAVSGGWDTIVYADGAGPTNKPPNTAITQVTPLPPTPGGIGR